MGASERRNAIMKLLCRRRHETIHNLAFEFDVSERTIRRDIDILSRTEPIYTQTGRYNGGVYVVEQYNYDKMYFQEDEISVLSKIVTYFEKQPGHLSVVEMNTLKRIIDEYTKPHSNTSKE